MDNRRGRGDSGEISCRALIRRIFSSVLINSFYKKIRNYNCVTEIVITKSKNSRYVG